MCNCTNNNISLCSRCSKGLSCGCPPDYSVLPLPVPCDCCPPGFTWVDAGNGIGRSGYYINYAGQRVVAPYTIIDPIFNVCAGTADLNANTVYSNLQVPGTPRLPSQFPTALKVPCTVCEDSVTTDCVFYNGVIPLTCNPSSIVPGDTLTTILNKLCFTNPANISAFLATIALDQTLLNGLCNLVANCGQIPGSTTPVIGPISWTIP